MSNTPGFAMTREQFMDAVAKQFDARFGPDGMPADLSAAVAAQTGAAPAPTSTQAGTPEYAKACRDAFMAGPGSMAPKRHDPEPDSGRHAAEDGHDAINPSYYQYSNGTQLIDITEHLNGNGAQAVQYVARATRSDGNNKGDVVEDLRKAIWFIKRELTRLSA